jgi:hypothetical protein
VLTTKGFEMAKLTLAALVAATAAAPGFTYATANEAKKLVEAGFAETNTDPAQANPANAKEFPVRATQAGIDQHNADVAKASAPKPAFTFSTAPLPTSKRKGGGRAVTYPFADFPAPENGIASRIFVPATEKMPDPVKSLASTVSQASRDFATVTGTRPGKSRTGATINKNIYAFTRKFSVEAGEENGVKGAYIYRIQ